MKTNNRQLSKKEQKNIVSKTNTGALPANVGFPGYSNKSKVISIKTNRKRG